MISLSTYRGEAPRISPRALPNEGAQQAINCRLLSGDLEAWDDIKDIASLVKAGPTNTMSLVAGKYWLNWNQGEIADGFQNVDVARVPIVNDLTYLTIYTGTGTPRITNLELATGGSTNAYGAYPLASDPLGVPAPLLAPTVVNTPGTSADTITTDNFVNDFSTWTTGTNGGAFGSWSVVSTNPGTGARPAMPGPYFAGFYQSPNSNYAQSPASFNFAASTSFTVDLDIGPDISNTDQAPNVYTTFLAGSQVGGRLNLNCRDGNNITWQDQSGGQASPTVIAGTVDQFHAYHVHAVLTNQGLNSTTGIRTFLADITVTLQGTSTIVATATGLTCTYGGENIVAGGYDGTGPDVQNVYLARVSISVSTPPSAFVPIYSNYVYTYDSSLGFESGPSPASITVQVDNGNVNAVTMPTPTGGQDVKKVFLYRAATGSAGTQYLQVVNGGTSDGGYPICVVGGTANAITLTDTYGAAPATGTSYFFVATGTNTGAVTVALDGNAPIAVVNGSGSALTGGEIVTGLLYAVEYRSPTTVVAQVTSAAGQAIVQLPTTDGILVGDAASDSSASIPAGATVTSISPGVSVTLSANLLAPIEQGDIVTFSAANFTLRNGYTVLDVTPTSQLGSPLPTADFDTPPDGLQGILALPNAIMAGFLGNTLYLSAQNQPQAYPLNYALATDSTIIGIGAIDTTVLILTDAHPYTAYGATPDAFTMTREEFIQGCVAKRSISYMRGQGIIYASTDGIYAYSGHGQIRCLTENLFTIKEWLPLNPASIIGIVHQGLYFFWFTKLDGTKGGYILDPNPQGFGLVQMDVHAISAALDTSDDSLFMVLDHGTIAGGVTPANNEQVQWDAAPTKRPYSWTSKIFQLAYPTAYALYRLRAAEYSDLNLKLYSNGGQYGNLTPRSDLEAPVPAQLVRQFQFALTGTSSVQPLQFVERARELLL